MGGLVITQTQNQEAIDNYVSSALAGAGSILEASSGRKDGAATGARKNGHKKGKSKSNHDKHTKKAAGTGNKARAKDDFYQR